MQWNNVLAGAAVLYLLLGFSMPAQQLTAPADQTAVPRVVNFNGVVLRMLRASLGPARCPLPSPFYEEQEGGTPLWHEIQNVTLDEQGLYSVLLGSNRAEGLPLDAFASANARWLGVPPELARVSEEPRTLLVGVPYALKAADADTLVSCPL
jgi:trimeric autotransporter adhesin